MIILLKSMPNSDRNFTDYLSKATSNFKFQLCPSPKRIDFSYP